MLLGPRTRAAWVRGPPLFRAQVERVDRLGCSEVGRPLWARDDLAVTTRLGYVPALDGLRGVAILLVIGNHYFLIPPGGGSTGVGLFFVLSGFLITTLLLEEHAQTGRIRLRAFYLRRARRLVPALAAMLAGYLVGAVIQGRVHVAVRAAAAAAFYTANISQAYWPHLIGREPIGPLWSLAEEEQFYLLWSALLVLLLALAVRRRSVTLGLGVAISAICAERFWLFAGHANNQRMYTSPESAADGILAGVLLAFVLWRRRREVAEELGPASCRALLVRLCGPRSSARRRGRGRMGLVSVRGAAVPT